MTILDFIPQEPLTPTLESQPENPGTVWIPEHILVSHRHVHSRPSSAKGCAEHAKILSPSHCLAACQTGLVWSFKTEVSRIFTLPWTDRREVIARKLWWERSACPSWSCIWIEARVELRAKPIHLSPDPSSVQMGGQARCAPRA